MRYYTFNSRKSVQQKRLIFNELFITRIFQYFQNFAVITFPFILSLGFLIIQLNIKNAILLPLSIVTLIASIFYTHFIYKQIIKASKFRKTKGIGKNTNIELVENICHKNGWKIVKSDEQSHVIIIEKAKIAYHLGRELFVVYENKEIYVRCLAYVRANAIHPFLWRSQRNIENSLIDDIREDWFG